MEEEYQGIKAPSLCESCGTPLGDDEHFCPKCGAPKPVVTQNTCGKCGTVLLEGQEFCPKCGQRAGLALDSNVKSSIQEFNQSIEKSKKKSKSIPIIIAAVVVALIGVTGFLVHKDMQAKEVARLALIEQQRIEEEQARIEAEKLQMQENIRVYRQNAASFVAHVTESAIKMEKIGNSVKYYWYTGYIEGKSIDGERYSSIDDAIEGGMSAQYTNVEAVKEARATVDEFYNALLEVPDPNDQQLQELKLGVKDLYSSYQDMYGCTTDPTGSYNSFYEELNNSIANITKNLQTLNLLLK